MQRTLDRLPPYLRAYCTEHDTSKYTARDHAAWRYIMRRAMDFFPEHAVSTYMPGFKKTGLRVDRIPHVDEIDHALQDIGWGAVPVVGFIAPWAFIEFQARKILPIATDMRSVEHIAYTPAPDIVHEAAGHAPILPDKDYSDYLAYYASLGSKAIYSKQDLMLYEAVRYLSDIKEKPESTAVIIDGAERRLQEALKAFTYTSEQALVARMSWWTAEYGLVGSLDAPKIYGAGLLSSVGESKHAMTSHVKKIRLSLDCIKYSYNITEPQPQLFVAESMQHLHDVLHELDAMLAYRIGGIEALKRGKEGEAVCTVDLNTKVGITGRLTEFEAALDRVDFIKFAGPVQISYENREMEGQGTARHAHGFSSPIGRLAGHTDRALASMNDNELRELGLAVNQNAKLRFASGFEVNGRVVRLHREKGQLVLVTFTDCSVRKNGQLYFDPAWGEFDMVVGDSVSSVYGGPADREKYGEQEITPAATTPARSTPFTPEELDGIACYQKLRVLRDNLARPGADKKSAMQELEQLADTVGKQHAGEWLLQLEVYELAREHLDSQGLTSGWVRQLSQRLEPSKQTSDDTRELVAEGLKLLH
jgi:phenylalanine-4-hydroxylase